MQTEEEAAEVTRPAGELACQTLSYASGSGKGKWVVGGQARRPANREVEIEQGLELLEAVGPACEFCVRLTKGRCSSRHNLDPRIPELEMKPIQEENGAAVTSRVGVAAERPVDVIWAPRIEPALSSRKAIEFCGIGVRGEHSR